MDIIKVWLSDEAVNVMTADGRMGFELFADYARLSNVPRKSLENYVVSDYGIHWPDLNEDLCFEGFFNKRPKSDLYRLFVSHPEINVASLARRLGIDQMSMAQMIGGEKVTPADIMDKIHSEMKKIGWELINAAG